MTALRKLSVNWRLQGLALIEAHLEECMGDLLLLGVESPVSGLQGC